MSNARDILIIGSGPSGAMAATTLVRAGLEVEMLDVGYQYDPYAEMIPELPFTGLRKQDPHQSRYLLGDRREGVPRGNQMVGALLTPPRQYVLEPSDSLRSPIEGVDRVEIRQSLALGGLGAAWGASCFTYSDSELRRMALDPSEFPRLYSEVASEIGVSGPLAPDEDADCYRFSFSQTRELQPPVNLDLNSRRTMQAYYARRDQLNQRGFYLGRSYLAVLTRDLGDRHANPYFDMDLYYDHRRSVYRPRYTIDELRRAPNFIYTPGVQVLRFHERSGGGVEVSAREVEGGAERSFRARRLLLCAGCINSARIALRSLGLFGVETPFLHSPGVFLPCANLHMLGRKPEAHRLSLAQISGVFLPPENPEDMVSFQFNHYSSLLLFKLVKEMPLPPWAGLLVARLLVSSLSVVGVYHADSPHVDSCLGLSPDGAIRIRYRPDAQKEATRLRHERQLGGLLRKLGYLPLSAVRPRWGTSMHYAGTIPMQESSAAPGLSTEPSYRLRGTASVFVGDSSTWNYLPAKGLTFTIMANAKKAAESLIRSLREDSR